VLPIGRRRELLSWAKTNKAWIIEDDYDSEFRYGLRPTETLQSLDADGTVIYIGTFSKALSPQLRLGYLVLPMSLVKAFRNAKQLTDRHAPSIEQNAVAELIKSGAYERHIRRVRRENEQRRSVLIESIAKYLPEGTLIEGTATGLHIVVWLEDFRVEDEVAIVAQAKSLGVGIWSITPLYALGRKMRKQNCAGFILGYAGLMPSEIKKGIKLLAKALLLRH
jgi:GntR family transcriptional regulator/MocR family aminotransferase